MAGALGQFEEQVYGLSTDATKQTAKAVKNAITAHAGGGQQLATDASALALNSINRVTVVGTIADSVTLPLATAGQSVVVLNQAANSLNVFPLLGDAINAGGANAAFAVAGNKAASFYCTIAGFWNAILSA